MPRSFSKVLFPAGAPASASAASAASCKTLASFALVIEFNVPIAALIPERLNAAQLRSIFALLPKDAGHDPELAARWNCAIVCCSPAWAREQKRRIPMLRPTTIVSLAFL